MSQPSNDRIGALAERMRASFGERATAIVIALALEALLLLVLLTLGLSSPPQHPAGPALTTFDASESEDPAETPAEEQQQQQPRPTQPQSQPRDTPPPPVEPSALPPQPAPAAAPILSVPRDSMVSLDISRMRNEPAGPPAPAQPAYGPADTGGGSPDTPRVGTAPNGEPLYAARWYREPSDDELAGYLSTARPGWGLIACKTAPDYRVEDCVALGEEPQGSQLARAILAAAWQFKVRPPRLGGKDMIGEWVRIRITYSRTQFRAGS
ncbi:conserved hypothetical protein [Altererythrobacter sp. B11]|uniref:hypothetical protein n=1 Tax=Altererythrobacter sp. B11 TaxID=2060312 RepID=UPI000DC706E9|nr:hypothetical protein [Altererythrobacter sp. B11]BBC72224.1 conserved hypothetical protein [Altererythrobacter sp. B11]